MNKIFAVILAGGKGTRIGNEVPKQFLHVGDKPVIIRTIEAFHSHDSIDKIIVTLPRDYISEIDDEIEKRNLHRIVKIVEGGSTRQASVYNALRGYEYDENDVILMHDAARPFVSHRIITDLIESVVEHGAAGTYIKAVDTIAEIEDEIVISIPPRDRLYYTQTPQGFKYSIIIDSHERALAGGITDSTDDISLAAGAGYEVRMVEGDYANIKITNENDLKYAEHLLGS